MKRKSEISGKTSINLERQVRAADVVPSTFNDDELTFDVCFSAGASVRRFDFDNWREYNEILSLEEGEVILDTLNSGNAPCLNAHSRGSVSDVIGKVVRAWLTDGKAYATIKMSRREEVVGIIQDIKDGILRQISMGYEVHEFSVTKSDEGDYTYTAIRWTPFEISLVPVGADQGAGIRAGEDKRPCVLTNREKPQIKESVMKKRNKLDEREIVDDEDEAIESDEEEMDLDDEDEAKGLDPDKRSKTQANIRQQAIREERARAAGIRATGDKLGSDTAVVEKLIADGVSLEKARAQLIDAHAKKQPSVRSISQGNSGDDPRTKARAMATAVAARFNSDVKIDDHAREYMHASISEIAVDLLRANGISIVTRNRAEIIQTALQVRSPGYVTGGDLPSLLADVANKLLLQPYGLAEPTYKKVTAEKSFRDFKAHNFMRQGEFPNLLKVDEHGEFKSGIIPDSGEKVFLNTYGRIFGITRQALINDDLGAFADMATIIGRRIPIFENDTVMALLALNSGSGPTMADGAAMCTTGRGNKASAGTVIDVANIGAARAAMMKRKSLGTEGALLNIVPSIILTGPDRLTQAEQLVATIQPQQSANVNPFSGKLTPVGDANISGNNWYLLADPRIAPVLVHGYLEGQKGPRVELRQGFETDGLEFKAAVDFAVGGIDTVGIYHNPGA